MCLPLSASVEWAANVTVVGPLAAAASASAALSVSRCVSLRLCGRPHAATAQHLPLVDAHCDSDDNERGREADALMTKQR